MIRSDSYIQKAFEGQQGINGMWRSKQWDCSLTPEGLRGGSLHSFGGSDHTSIGSGMSIQYGITYSKGYPASPPGVNITHYFAFTPYFSESRTQGPTFLVDAWPGGTVRLPYEKVTIEAYIGGGWSAASSVEPVMWYWGASPLMLPVTRAPTYTAWWMNILPLSASALMPIPHRARSVRVHVSDGSYSTGNWYEWEISGSTRINAIPLPGASGTNTGEIPISGLGRYYSVGNSNTSAKTVTCQFALDL